VTPTIHSFEIELSDVDRGVYQTLAIRAARHPSETEDHLVTRVLAYCLEYAEGIAFSNGLAEPDEPPLAVRDLTGVMRVWIDIGAPDAARMHKAGKAAARVVVYTHKDPERVACSWAGEHIHRGAELELYLELYSVARPFLAELVARLKRRMVFALGTARARDRLTWPGPIFPGLAIFVP